MYRRICLNSETVKKKRWKRIPRYELECRRTKVWSWGKQKMRSKEPRKMSNTVPFSYQTIFQQHIFVTFASKSCSPFVLPEIMRFTWNFRCIKRFSEVLPQKSFCTGEKELLIAASMLSLFNVWILMHGKWSNKNIIWEFQLCSLLQWWEDRSLAFKKRLSFS